MVIEKIGYHFGANFRELIMIRIETVLINIITKFKLQIHYLRENYSKAVESLRARFGRGDLLIEVYLRELLKL